MEDLRGLVLDTRGVRTHEIEVHEASPELKRVLFMLPRHFDASGFFTMCHGVGIPPNRHQALLDEALSMGFLREAGDE